MGSRGVKKAADGSETVQLRFGGPAYEYAPAWCGNSLGPTNIAQLVLEHLSTGSPLDAGYPQVGLLATRFLKPAGETLEVSGTYKDNEKSIAYTGTITLTYVRPK